MAKTHIGILELDRETALPNLRSTKGGFGFQGTTPKYWNGTQWASFSGGSGNGSLNDAYDDGTTVDVNGLAVRMAGVHATNNVLEMLGTGSGNIIDITNTGTGADIDGTSSTWSVSKTGAAIFNASVTSPVIVSYGAGADANLTINAKGSGTISIGGTSTGAVTVTRALTATASITVTGAAGSDKLTVTAGDVKVTDGSITVADDDNAASLAVANSAATTIGAAAAGGIFQLSAPALTTGSLLSLELTEGTLNGGWYVRAWDVTGSAQVFSVGEDGATIIAGAAGSNVLSITAGDAVLSDGSLALTDADNASTLSVVNNTATTAAVISFVSTTGVFTGVTTGSYMHVSQSALTTGTLARFTAVGATTSVGVVDIATAGLTSGSALRVATSTAAFTTGGKAIEVDLVSAVAGNGMTVTTGGVYTGTGLAVLTAGAMTTGVGLSVVSTTGLTTGSLIRATSSTAGAIATNGAISFSATGNFTSTARAGFVNVAANTTAAGYVSHISATALTTGTILSLDAVEATLTTGKYLECFDGAANDFSIAKYGATIIAGNAQGTAALTVTAGDLVLTAGNATIGGKIIASGTETIAAGGTTTALSLLKTCHYIDADAGGDIFTLANGVEGQIMFIVCASATGVCTVTPATMKGGTNVILNAAGDAVTLAYIGAGWSVVGGNGYTIS